MRRQIAGLRNAALSEDEVPDGLCLVQVRRVQYSWHALKPFYLVRFVVLEPESSAQTAFSARLYCTAKALWKLAWFLRDFGYDTALIADDQIDEKALIGLRGVVKISHAIVHGISVLNLDGFAPAARWTEMSSSSDAIGIGPDSGEVAS